MDDSRDIDGALRRLADVYQRKLEDHVVAAYRQALQDLTPEQVRLACDRCARTRRYFPRPVEIRDALAESAQMAPRRLDLNAPVCEECGGNGWVEYQCPGDGSCGHPACPKLGYAHGVASRCPTCRPAYKRRA